MARRRCRARARSPEDRVVYEVVPYRAALKPQIVSLQQHLWWGGAPINTAYLEWKYERNPYLPSPLLYVALYQGRVVAMRGLFGSCWEVGADSARHLVPCADDFVIAPAHRNRGLAGRIMTAPFADPALRPFDVVFS